MPRPRTTGRSALVTAVGAARLLSGGADAQVGVEFAQRRRPAPVQRDRLICCCARHRCPLFAGSAQRPSAQRAIRRAHGNTRMRPAPARPRLCASARKRLQIVIAPLDALETTARTSSARRSCRVGRCLVGRHRVAISSSLRATSRRRASMSKVISSPSATAAMGPPRTASGATWPAIRPCVAPEKRPSVSSATCSPSPAPFSAAVTAASRAYRGPRRALVADHDNVAGDDRAVRGGSHRGLLAFEHPRGPAVVAALVAGELHDAALGGKVAAQDREAPGRLDRIVKRADHLLPGVSRAAAAISPSVWPVTVGASSCRRPACAKRWASRATPPAR